MTDASTTAHMWDCDGSVGPQDRVRKICGRCEMPTRLLHEKDSSLQRRFFYGQVWIFFIYIFGMLTRLPTQIKSSQQSLSRFNDRRFFFVNIDRMVTSISECYYVFRNLVKVTKV